MARKEEDKEKLSPLTFKVPYVMFERMQKLVERGDYRSRAELIRQAIDNFIQDETRYSS